MEGSNILGLMTVLTIIIMCMSMPSLVQSISVRHVVTEEFFDSIMNSEARDGYCPGRYFYTRYAFLNAYNSLPSSYSFGDGIQGIRAIAAFFAHANYMSNYFCHIGGTSRAPTQYCNSPRSCPIYRCKPGRSYHARGPLQLTWHCNYGACGDDLGLDLLNRPELASWNATAAFKTSLWYWIKKIQPAMSRGFGATIRAINSSECGGFGTAIRRRVRFYERNCDKLDVDPGYPTHC